MMGRIDLYFLDAMCKTVVICMYTYGIVNTGFELQRDLCVDGLKHRKLKQTGRQCKCVLSCVMSLKKGGCLGLKLWVRHCRRDSIWKSAEAWLSIS